MRSISKIYLSEANRIINLYQQKTGCVLRSLCNQDLEFYFLQFEQVSSTMIFSQNWNKELLTENKVFVFTAQKQVAGRGQRSNKWQSPSGNLYATILSKQSTKIIPYLYCSVCTSIIDTIQSNLKLPKPPTLSIKWINDITIGSQKLGGILLKTDIDNLHTYTQLGIGLNIASAPALGSTCLAKYIEPNLLNRDFYDLILDKLAINVVKNWRSLQATKEQIIQKYNERLLYKEMLVNIYDDQLRNVKQKGIFKGINSYGFAILQNGSNFIQVSSGRMRKPQNQ